MTTYFVLFYLLALLVMSVGTVRFSFGDIFEDVGDFISDIFTGGGKSAARTSESLATAAEQRTHERFKELRETNQQDFENMLARLQLLKNPLLSGGSMAPSGLETLSGLQREFASAPQAAAGRRLASAGALARTAGGPRSGQTFGLARADLARRLQAEAGLEASILRLQGLQGRTGISQLGAQLSEADIARQANLFGQERQIQGTLAQALLGGQAGIAATQVGQTGQILSTGIETGLPAAITGGIQGGISALIGAGA